MRRISGFTVNPGMITETKTEFGTQIFMYFLVEKVFVSPLETINNGAVVELVTTGMGSTTSARLASGNDKNTFIYTD